MPRLRDDVISIALLFPAIHRRKVWIVQQITWQSGIYAKNKIKQKNKK